MSMKTVEEIKEALPPKTKFFFPQDDGGIARFKLHSTKHRFKIRVVFTWFEGVDMVQAMYKNYFTPTKAEMKELMHLFFPADEWEDCVIMKHPTVPYAMLLYRLQEGDANGT